MYHSATFKLQMGSLSWKPENRITAYENDPTERLDEEGLLRKRLMDAVVQQACLATEMKQRMWRAIEKVGAEDEVVGTQLEARRSIEFQAYVCEKNTDDEAMFSINSQMVASLNDFGGHEALEELIEQRRRLKGIIRKTEKELRTLVRRKKTLKSQKDTDA